MAHIPVNHPLRPLYRVLAALIGLYVLVFGVWGFVRTQGNDFVGHQNLPTVLGLKVNPAFAVLSVVAGVLLLAGTVIGRNLDHYLKLTAAVLFMVVATAMLLLLRTEANVLGFTVTTVVVSYVFGMTCLAAGLYGKVGTEDDAHAEEAFRHNVR